MNEKVITYLFLLYLVGFILPACDDHRSTEVAQKIEEKGKAEELSKLLSDAIDKSDLNAVKEAIGKGAAVQGLLPNGQSPLMHTLQRANVYENNGKIISNNNGEIADYLLDVGANPNEMAADGTTPLLVCSFSNHITLAQTLIRHGANANLATKAYEGKTPLMLAIDNGSEPLVNSLLSNGAEAEAVDATGKSVWEHVKEEAARNEVNIDGSDSWDIAYQLKSYGANLLQESTTPPIFTAVLTHNTELLKKLIAGKANINEQTTGGITPAMLAAARGYTDALGELVQAGANLNLRNQYGDTAISLAVMFNHHEAAAMLMEKGALVNSRNNREGLTPLMLAVRWADIPMIDLLVKHQANIETKDDAGFTALMHSIYHCEEAAALHLLELGANPNCCTGLEIGSALHLACSPVSCNAAIVRSLLQHGAKVDAEDNDRQQPLGTAVEFGYSELAEILIAAGADVNHRDKLLRTPIMRTNSAECIKLLLAHQAELNAKTARGLNALMYAALYGHSKCITPLVHAGLNVDETEYSVDNFNALMYAIKPLDIARFGQCDCIQQLLLNGANVNFHTGGNLDKTPLTYAAELNNLAVVKLLLDAGADVNMAEQTEDGMSPILYAAQNGNMEMVELLIERGAKLDRLSQSGYSALVGAVGKGNTELARYMLDRGISPNFGRTYSGFSPLALAAAQGNEDMVSMLLSAGADWKIQDRLGKNAYDNAKNERVSAMIAAKGGHPAAEKTADKPKTKPPLCHAVEDNSLLVVVHIMRIDKGKTNVNEVDANGNTPLLLCKSFEIAMILLESGADPNKANAITGETPLCRAIQLGDVDMVELLIHYGADIDKRSAHGISPIKQAFVMHRPSCAALLLKKGAEYKSDLISIASLAVLSGCPQSLQLLLDRGLSPNQADNGQTLLMEAALGGNTECVEMLLKAGADPKAVDQRGKTAYSYALIGENLKLMDLLYKVTIERK